MLSVEECIKLAEDPEISKKEVEELRNAYYELAELSWDVYQDKKYGSKNPLGLLQENK